MSLLRSLSRWLLSRPATLALLAAWLVRLADALRRRNAAATRRRQAQSTTLPSLLDAHPGATAATRRRVGLRSVPVERIVGTMRSPSQNTADFLPLRGLRGRNWRARWQRIQGETERLTILPPVDLVKVGDEYWVSDGHNRIAAAIRNGALEIDADVTELLLPGAEVEPPVEANASDLDDALDIKEAASGRTSRTARRRPRTDALTRDDLLRGPQRAEAAEDG